MTEVLPSTQPRSWAEDVQTYRTSRGSQSFSTVDSAVAAGTAPLRFSRTTHRQTNTPDANGQPLRHLIQDPAVTTTRYNMHGWGDTSLLKQEGYQGTTHPRGIQKSRDGKATVAQPERITGRQDLFGVLNGQDAGVQDGWIGNPGVDPRKGRRSTQRKGKGGADLFEVLQQRNPGKPQEDSWIGNIAVDPNGGKAPAPPPSKATGFLREIIQYTIVNDPRRAELMKKGADPYCDAWCGNRGITPDQGKADVQGARAATEDLRGAVFNKPVPENWSDLRRRHLHPVPPPVVDTTYQIIQGTAGLEAGERRQKKELKVPLGHTAVQRTDHLYSHLTYKPISQVEQQAYSKGMDDSRVPGGKAQGYQVPGTTNEAKDMLLWKPEQQLGSFVPRGGLMQDGRRTRPSKNSLGGTLRGGTPPSALSRF